VRSVEDRLKGLKRNLKAMPEEQTTMYSLLLLCYFASFWWLFFFYILGIFLEVNHCVLKYPKKMKVGQHNVLLMQICEKDRFMIPVPVKLAKRVLFKIRIFLLFCLAGLTLPKQSENHPPKNQ